MITFITDSIVKTFDGLETALDYIANNSLLDQIEDQTIIHKSIHNTGVFGCAEFSLLEVFDKQYQVISITGAGS